MTDDETEETIILTRRDRRRAGAEADAAQEQPPADVDEATVVVNRTKAAQAVEPASSTADADASVEPAASVEPVAPVEPGSSEAPVEPDASDAAHVPEAEDALDEATVVVDRSAASKTDAPEEATVVVSRPARRLRRKRIDTEDAEESKSGETADARRVESFAAPTDGPAPAIYKPRPAPLAPVAPPVVVGAAAPTRVEAPGLPSVAKQGRRWSLIALTAAAGACVVSVAGLAALGFVVFG